MAELLCPPDSLPYNRKGNRTQRKSSAGLGGLDGAISDTLFYFFLLLRHIPPQDIQQEADRK